MCIDTTKTIHACGCTTVEHKPGSWCLLGDQCQEIDHRHIATKRTKETCAKCLENKDHKEEEEFLEEDGFTVVTKHAKNVKSADTATVPKRPTFIFNCQRRNPPGVRHDSRLLWRACPPLLCVLAAILVIYVLCQPITQHWDTSIEGGNGGDMGESWKGTGIISYLY
ncbi:hypothetical protein PG993_010555 [Apiospora rasikravindrae]|uniref:Uncharacterized protein n=1 Tax=Apiospora rasikravindrae TaxID=990691 RepID=A0ABR1SML4_9PEZI